MIGPVFAGGVVGLGLLLLGLALWPPAPTLADALAQLRSARPVMAAPTLGAVGRWDRAQNRMGAELVAMLASLGIDTTKRRDDLRVLDSSLERLMMERLLYGVAGLVLVPAMVAVLALGGVHVSLLLPLWASLVVAAGFAYLPGWYVGYQAAARRRSMRHTLSSFLDLVAISLAGGAGLEGALQAAVAVGDGWAVGQLRDRLDLSRRSGVTPWTGLGQLGEELGIDELRELEASLSLTGSTGASVEATLAAKAAAMRVDRIAEAEQDSQTANRNMAFPQALLALGFLLFLGFPPVMRIMGGLN